MATQISNKDWRRVTARAWAVVRARDHARTRRAKRHLLRFLDELDATYGETVDVLATRADYTTGARKRAWLLRRAYRLAEKLRDSSNLMLVAHSLAEHYAGQKGKTALARHWLEILKAHLRRKPDDDGRRWAIELEKQLGAKPAHRPRRPR